MSKEILIVDDNAANLQLLVAALEDDYTVRAAISGKLALDSARQQAPHMVLLDVMMPEMNGFDVCQAFQADPNLKAIPIIFISGISDQLSTQEIKAVGAVDFLTKPIDLRQLFAKIKQHLGESQV